jgi:hypothetical protein
MKCNHSNITKGCKHCQKLSREWNKKLEKSGVENIEQEDGNLKQWHSFHFARKSHSVQNGGQTSKEEYYRLAGHFLHNYPFEVERDRRIWELHAEGLFSPDIVKRLSKQGFRVKTSIVHETVKKLTKIMIGQLWSS